MSKLNTLVIYGDSISTTEFGGGGYQDLLYKQLNVDKIYNHAVSASATALTSVENLMNILSNENNIHEDADLIIIWYGTNDWYWGNKLGNGPDDNVDTFFGALNAALKILQSRCKKANIILLTPIFRNQVPFGVEDNGESVNAYFFKNKVGCTLNDYKQVLMKTSEIRCVPILDTHVMSQINEYNFDIFLEDGIHPSKLGYERIGKVLINYINTYYR